MKRTIYLTRTAYLKSIEDALLEQLERVSSSKEEEKKSQKKEASKRMFLNRN